MTTTHKGRVSDYYTQGRGSDPIYYTQGRGREDCTQERGQRLALSTGLRGGDNLQNLSLRVAMTTLGPEFSSPGVSFLLETPSLSPYLVREVTSIKCKNSDTTSSTDM